MLSNIRLGLLGLFCLFISEKRQKFVRTKKYRTHRSHMQSADWHWGGGGEDGVLMLEFLYEVSQVSMDCP